MTSQEMGKTASISTYKPDRSNRNNKRPHERHDLAYHSGRQTRNGTLWKAFFTNNRLKTTSTTHDLYHHDYDNPNQHRTTKQTGTTKTHDQNEDDTKDDEQDDDDTVFIFSQLIDT